MNKVSVFWWLAMLGYTGLLLLLVLWFAWLAPSAMFPRSLVLLVMTAPLLFPLRGLLHGRPYTFAWTSFLALFYLIHGITEAWSDPAVRHLALLEILFSVLLYSGAMLYARYQGRALKRLLAQESGVQKG